MRNKSINVGDLGVINYTYLTQTVHTCRLTVICIPLRRTSTYGQLESLSYLCLEQWFVLFRHLSIFYTIINFSKVGPTFGCIIGRSFHNLKHGDRFWYENGGWTSSFTQVCRTTTTKFLYFFLKDQLENIRNVKLSRIICDNSDHIKTVQVMCIFLIF